MRTLILSMLMVGLFISTTCAQQTLDLNITFPPGSGTMRTYSIYIPSGYQNGTPNALMVGFHPFNTSRWNSTSWRDTLVDFAEANDLLMICPDGGLDGRVDDNVDYDFATALIDTMISQYSVDEDRIFAIGFSVGGKATYEYGLMHASRFRGFIPIGAAINGTTEVAGLLDSAFCKAYYIVHGNSDAPGTRFTPIKDALIQNAAVVDHILMGGVGHTIDFPNRNQVLTNAFRYVDTATCQFLNVEELHGIPGLEIESKIIATGEPIRILIRDTQYSSDQEIQLIDIRGKKVGITVQSSTDHITATPSTTVAGVYLLLIRSGEDSIAERILIRN